VKKVYDPVWKKWNTVVEEETPKPDYKEQMKFDFTSDSQKTAQQQGIRWAPEDATPEQVKEWHDTEGKWWADRALQFVVIASLIQFGAISFMLFNFFVIDLMVGK
tara:strand:+ start:412 stop:726 length:315 start_codon:yes stop_codon:yes gene_type:complete